MSCGDDLPTRNTEMDDDAFNRLPLAVQLATKLKREGLSKNSAEHVVREQNRARYAGFIMFLVFFLCHALTVDSWLIILILSAIGGAAGYLLIYKRWHYLAGFALFGGVSIVGCMVALKLGYILPQNMTLVFFGWMMLCVASIFLTRWVDGDRARSE